MGELGLRLHDFYEMTWYEYQLMCYSYYRKEDKEWQRFRYLTWHTLASSMSIDSRKLPSLTKFVTGENKASKVASEETKNQFLEEYKEYLKKSNPK